VDAGLIRHWRAAPGDFAGALMAGSALLALSFDAGGRVLRESPALARLRGARLEGRALAEAMTPASAALFADAVLPQLRAQGSVEGAELDLTAADGTALPVRMSALCELDPAGGVLRAVALLTDLRETRAVMAALEEKAAEAEDASAAKSRFLAAMSHEIRTPMNAILGFAQLLEMDEADPTRAGHIAGILSAGRSLMALLTDLLDHAQVEAGQMRVAPSAVDLDALLAEVESWWRPAAADRGLAFAVTRDPALPARVTADPTRLQQVLNNYLANAVKFTQTGRVALDVGLHEGAPGGPALRFRVCDTGPGIAPHDVARLYRPFVQVGAAADAGAAAQAGWGLGLSICARIAEAMGARVGVDTAPGRGSVFWLDLPLRLPAAPPLPAAAEERSDARTDALKNGDTGGPEPATRPLRLLVAEDDALNLDVMRRLLADMGHEVESAGNGFEALDKLQAGGFDAVLMDVMMPGLDGVAATRRLRAGPGPARDIPVIACSAHVGAEAAARYRAEGMTAFLPKPVDRAALRAVLAEVAGAAQA